MSVAEAQASSRPSVRAGLCSVTLRHLPAVEVLRIAVEAGLSCIEWGGDIHVPAGDLRTAANLRRASREHGIRVASYGSYFRCGAHSAEEFAPLLATAAALGAPRIRIWAGTVASGDASREQRAAVTAVTRAAATRAADTGIRLSFEHHGGTLTDTPDSTLRLLDDVGHPAVDAYWQPPVGADDTTALHGLTLLLPRVSAVHVFSWWPERERLALPGREPLWRAVFTAMANTPGRRDALLEFVRGDDPSQLRADAAALVDLIRGSFTSPSATD